MDKKILTLYFTRSGHTKHVAEVIGAAVGGDIAEIKTRRTYSSSYFGAIVQGGLEKMKNARPELEPLSARPADYDVIFLGTPVWWFTITPAMKSFLESADLDGKTVIPFITNGGKPSAAPADFTAALHLPEDACFSVCYKGNTPTVGDEDIRAWAGRMVQEL